MSYNITNFHFKSKILAANRIVTLAIPTDYQPQTNIPLWLVFDGQQLIGNEKHQILNDYQKNKIFLGISANDNLERFADLTTYQNNAIKPLMELHFPKLKDQDDPNLGGKGEQFWQFIIQELLPAIIQQYQIKVDNYNLIGCSLGAYYCLQLLYLSNLTFENCYLLSPSLWFNQQLKIDLQQKGLNQRQPININLWVGLKEPHWFEKTLPVDYYQDAITVKTILTQKTNIKLTFSVSENGGHGYRWWITAINQFLKGENC